MPTFSRCLPTAFRSRYAATLPPAPVLALTLILALTGCARQAPDSTPAPPAVAQVPVYAPYDTAVLADLLIAELAAQRNQLDVSLDYYARAARDTRSPQVTGQAARLAAYLEQPALALALSEHWLTLDPTDTTPLEIAALSHISLGDTDALLARDPQEGLLRLVTQARGLDQGGNTRLLIALASLTDRYPDQAPLWYARALHLQLQDNPEAALTSVDEALRRQPDHEEALLLKGRLLFELGHQDQALRHMQRLVRKYPQARRARVLYVRLLLEDGQTDNAFRELSVLAEQFPEDRDIRYSLALYGLEHGARERSREVLEALMEDGYREDEIRGFLAQLAEQEGEVDEAIEHYIAIRDPELALRARVQAARLYQEHDRPEEREALMARLRDHYPAQLPVLYSAEAELMADQDPEGAYALLEAALTELPDDLELRYARALIAERLDRLDQAEADFRYILAEQPDDPHALNALGYTLTDRTDRHEEAYGYIRRALTLRPDSPAIMDSMGWVLFNMGRAEDALPYLEQAYTMFPDDEIAAHLGEVLWSLGREDDARAVWQESLQREPDGRYVREVLNRLTGQSL